MNCPHCNQRLPKSLLDEVAANARSKVASGAAKARKVHSGGRPRSADRCACSAMTAARAKARGHKCKETK